jgi:hypothetical protein
MLEKHARVKRSNLLGLAFNEKGKESIEFRPVVNVVKLFFLVTDNNKLEHLLQSSRSSLV